MRCQVTSAFLESFATLPDAVKPECRAALRLVEASRGVRHLDALLGPKVIPFGDPDIPAYDAIVCIRVAQGFRAFGFLRGMTYIIWFWLGTRDHLTAFSGLHYAG